ncbi:PRD domain-containing protein [uncultured Dubosiella sp.]|uniref:PRD domain-containing protein n=1 Tax=uncultured Dubosiella sp. TaxID=1937011 RepID=UPI002615E7E3|nr:PRD domain-containing protein [uncultured Dubosiella sp.]
MKIIKKINNNVAIGLDQNGKEVVVFGKGIGFEKMPYTLTDLSKVDRSYYDVDPRYYELISSVDERVLLLCTKMVNVIMAKLEGEWNPSLVFVLADHITFALERYRKGMAIPFPYSDEIELECPDENRWAVWIVKNINHNFHVKLPKGEVTCIAMHLVNARVGTKTVRKETSTQRKDRILKFAVDTIEHDLGISISKKDLNYYRFKSHISYFVKRKDENTPVSDEGGELFELMKTTYPDAYRCAMKINSYLKEEYGSDCSDSEILYLMIHINRFMQRGL